MYHGSAYYRMNSSMAKGIQFGISDRKYFVKFVLEVSKASQASYGKIWDLLCIHFQSAWPQKELTMNFDTSEIIYFQQWEVGCFILRNVVIHLNCYILFIVYWWKMQMLVNNLKAFSSVLKDQFLIISFRQCRWCSSNM